VRDKVLAAKRAHPDWGYGRIARLVGTTHGTVAYYLAKNRKAGILAAQRKRREAAKKAKIENTGTG
jgi:hypothetical protein